MTRSRTWPEAHANGAFFIGTPTTTNALIACCAADPCKPPRQWRLLPIEFGIDDREKDEHHDLL